MSQYTVKHQSDPKLCVDCGHFYQEHKSGMYCCSAGHDEEVGRYAEACKDFKEDE